MTPAQQAKSVGLKSLTQVSQITSTRETEQNEMKYEAPKGWNIAYNPKPVPTFLGVDYDYWHDDYDGENDLAGSAGSVKECWEEIANIEI